jgi:hypothetical protein
LKITEFSERLLENYVNFIYKGQEGATKSPVDISANTLKLFIEESLRFLWLGILNCLFETTAFGEFALVDVSSSNKVKRTARLREFVIVMVQYMKI